MGRDGLYPRHRFLILTKRPAAMLAWLDPAHDNREHAAGNAMCVLSGGADPGLPEWPLPNVGLGVSVEDQPTADVRIPLVLRCPAPLHFVSAEPLLSPIDLSAWLAPVHADDIGTDWLHEHVPGLLTSSGCYPPADEQPWYSGLDWVIAGGETGPAARPVYPGWLRDLRDACLRMSVPFFLKSFGQMGRGPHVRSLDGCAWEQMPSWCAPGPLS